MKTAVSVVAVFAIAINFACADTIVLWDCNSQPPDGTNSTGTLAPAVGSGTAAALGGLSESFLIGCTRDPAADNSAWSTSHYPAATTSNLQAGVSFFGSTAGYENINLSWYQQNSGTASRYLRVQYTIDGTTFVNAEPIALYKESSFTNQTVDLSGVAGAANNPSFGFRLLAEFESTATGAGTNNYVATKDDSNYGVSGAIRFDLVTISGTPIFDGNTPPYILCSIPGQTLKVGQSTAALSFTVLDAEDPARSLTLGKTSSNPAAVPITKITFAGTNATRTVQVKAGTQPGSSTVTVYVFDTAGKSNSASFNVTVLPENLPPAMSVIGTTNTLVSTSAGPVPFTVWDAETPAANLVVTGTCANPALVPNTGLIFGGSGSNRTVSITPTPGQTGVAPITLTVSDGTNNATSVFAVVVTPSSAIVLLDPFTYPDGPLVPNSGYLWSNASGTEGDCQVNSGQLGLSGDLSEDVEAPLIGAPYYPSNSPSLYVAFKVKLLDQPKIAPGYFAYFQGGNYSRARISVGTSNAWTGFRFLVANGTGTPVAYPVDMHTNEIHTLVARYNVGNSMATLWVDPAAETATGATGEDIQPVYRVNTFALRQDASLGANLQIDDLRVGMTFAAVMGTNTTRLPVPLRYECAAGKVVLRWTEPGFVLQGAPSVTGIFTNITGASSPFTNLVTGPSRFFRLKAE